MIDLDKILSRRPSSKLLDSHLHIGSERQAYWSLLYWATKWAKVSPAENHVDGGYMQYPVYFLMEQASGCYIGVKRILLRTPNPLPLSVIFRNSVKSDSKLEFNSSRQILSKRPSLNLLDSHLEISSKQQSHSSKLKWANFSPAENQLISFR